MRLRVSIPEEEWPDSEAITNDTMFLRFSDYNGKSLDDQRIVAIDTETGEAIVVELKENGRPKLDAQFNVVTKRVLFLGPLTVHK